MKFDFKALSQVPVQDNDGETSEMFAGDIAHEKNMRGEELAPAGAMATPEADVVQETTTVEAGSEPIAAVASSFDDLLKVSAAQKSDQPVDVSSENISEPGNPGNEDALQGSESAAIAVAAEGAKELVDAAGLMLSAAYADDSSAGGRDMDRAREIETAAYKKLASVDATQAAALVEQERSKITRDGQLQTAVRFDAKQHAAFAGGEQVPPAAEAPVKPQKAAGPVKLDFSALLRRSEGKMSDEELSKAVAPPAGPAKSGMFSGGAVVSEEDEHEVDALVRAVQKKHEEFTAGAPKAGGGAAPVPSASAVVSGHAPGPQFGTTIGGLAGRVAGEVVATPFIALSSAAKHLRQRLGNRMSAMPAGPAGTRSSMIASTRSASLANTLETITHWKCDRIEKAANEAISAAKVLTSTEEFVVWSDKVREVAQSHGVPTADIVARMHEDVELADVKSSMDALWAAHPEKVSAYRDAGDAFVRGINSVVKEFPNSPEDMRDRVGTSINKVIDSTEMLPGFGAEQGEYHRKLAERIREIVRAISEFIQRLQERLTGKQSSPEMVV